ncbi:MAG: serine hydrolase [Deltaproteobacteria bacterium]|nr:serine hydrolase [Deltaproteobacteria bacterium]
MEFVSSLFTGAEQYENFNRLAKVFPSHRIEAPAEAKPFPEGEALEIPASFEHGGAAQDTAKFLEETDTAALLVVHDGKLRAENYWLTGGRDVNWMSMSVGKSFVSALIGAAVAEGKIRSIEEPVTAYVTELAGSAYDGVRIKDILQMSSGAKWNEDYSDPESDIGRFAAVFGSGASLNEFTTTLTRAHEPGTVNHYNSADTQVLGSLLRAATGTSLAEYAQRKLWQPLGMEADGYWITDDSGMEMAFGGLQVTARDYAKFGELYRLGGMWHGQRVLDEAWVRASVTPDAPHVMPGRDPSYPLGYAYQWWIPDGGESEFSAIGVYNQFVYVHPKHRVVIVKLSANSSYGTTNDDSSWRELETFSLFRAIAKAVEPER